MCFFKITDTIVYIRTLKVRKYLYNHSQNITNQTTYVIVATVSLYTLGKYHAHVLHVLAHHQNTEYIDFITTNIMHDGNIGLHYLFVIIYSDVLYH